MEGLSSRVKPTEGGREDHHLAARGGRELRKGGGRRRDRRCLAFLVGEGRGGHLAVTAKGGGEGPWGCTFLFFFGRERKKDGRTQKTSEKEGGVHFSFSSSGGGERGAQRRERESGFSGDEKVLEGGKGGALLSSLSGKKMMKGMSKEDPAATFSHRGGRKGRGEGGPA